MSAYRVRGTVTELERLSDSWKGSPRYSVTLHTAHGVKTWRTLPDHPGTYSAATLTAGQHIIATVDTYGHFLGHQPTSEPDRNTPRETLDQTEKKD